MADHIPHPDPEAAAEVPGEAQGRAELAAVAEDVGVRVAGVLDADRGPVEADGVATKALKTAPAVGATAMCSTITRGCRRRQVRSP
jgi:hypothetical protein